MRPDGQEEWACRKVMDTGAEYGQLVAGPRKRLRLITLRRSLYPRPHLTLPAPLTDGDELRDEEKMGAAFEKRDLVPAGGPGG
jgi:hypothetical protein